MNYRQKQFLLLQINDALFPIGGYSHSYGLETYIQNGLVTNEKTAEKFIRNTLHYNSSHTDLLAVSLSHQYAKNGDMPKISELSELLSAVKVPMEIRKASMKLGSRFVKTVGTFPVILEHTIFQEYRKEKEGFQIHHPVAYGVFCAAAGISYDSMLEAFLYAQVSAMVTNCVKSIPLSQTVGQKMLFQLHDFMEEILEKVSKLTIADLGKTAPGFDIRSMQHEALYSRLYMS